MASDDFSSPEHRRVSSGGTSGFSDRLWLRREEIVELLATLLREHGLWRSGEEERRIFRQAIERVLPMFNESGTTLVLATLLDRLRHPEQIEAFDAALKLASKPVEPPLDPETIAYLERAMKRERWLAPIRAVFGKYASLVITGFCAAAGGLMLSHLSAVARFLKGLS